MRISTTFIRDFFTETRLREHFGQTDKITLMTCLKHLPIGRTPRGHATACFLEGFLEGSLKEVLLRRVLRRRLVRVSVGTGVFRRVLRRGGGVVIEGAQKVLRRQKHAISQSTTPLACTLIQTYHALFRELGTQLLGPLLSRPHSPEAEYSLSFQKLLATAQQARHII